MPLTARPLGEDTLRRIFADDQSIYPAPLTLDQLRGWVEAAPELSVALHDDDDDVSATALPVLVGVIVVLPLRMERWQALLEGKLKETDINPDHDFAVLKHQSLDGPRQFGLHVFHVERYSEDKKYSGFAEKALRLVEQRASAAASSIDGAVIAGWSALTATKDGRRTTESMGLEPTGYEEVFLRDEGSGEVRMVCKMAGTRPDGGDEEPVDNDGAVVARTQMVVRHGAIWGKGWRGMRGRLRRVPLGAGLKHSAALDLS